MIQYVILIALSVFLILLPWFRRQRLLPAQILGEIRPISLRDLKRHLAEESPCAGFWAATGGIPGLWKRLVRMRSICRLLQAYTRAGAVSREDAAYVWQQATLQVLFSLLALPESIFCFLWDKIPHVCAQASLQAHCNLSLRTITLCGNEGTDMCADLSRLL